MIMRGWHTEANLLHSFLLEEVQHPSCLIDRWSQSLKQRNGKCNGCYHNVKVKDNKEVCYRKTIKLQQKSNEKWNDVDSMSKEKKSNLLNQSPELYESRSSDFERNISSPEWKNGIP